MKALDFGLVKEVSAQRTKAQLTEREVVMGTPDCMPPELAMADENIDGRADLYSLGCVAYWLFTGSMLFSADSPIQILMKHVNATPDAPSAYSQLPIPPELDTLVLQCLEKDPANRPNNAGELSTKLRVIPLHLQWGHDDARRW